MSQVSETETEVSNEQPTTEVEDKPETEPETTEEDSEEEAEVENEEASESEDAFTSVNPDELPDELKSIYKNMQADYTRSKHAIKAIEEKAKLYEQLQQDQLIQQRFPQPAQQAAGETTNYLAESLGVDVNTLDQQQRQELDLLAKIVDGAVNKRIGEHIVPIQNKMTYREYEQELEEARSKFPDFDEYAPSIQNLTQQDPQLSYEDAYKIASYENAEKRGRTSAFKNQEVKKKQAGLKTAADAKENDEPDNNFDSIFNWAKKKTSS